MCERIVVRWLAESGFKSVLNDNKIAKKTNKQTKKESEFIRFSPCRWMLPVSLDERQKWLSVLRLLFWYDSNSVKTSFLRSEQRRDWNLFGRYFLKGFVFSLWPSFFWLILSIMYVGTGSGGKENEEISNERSLLVKLYAKKWVQHSCLIFCVYFCLKFFLWKGLGKRLENVETKLNINHIPDIVLYKTENIHFI